MQLVLSASASQPTAVTVREGEREKEHKVSMLTIRLVVKLFVFGFADLGLIYVVNSHRAQVTN